jgi:DNA polymerase III epsilon subunit-like protein
MSLVICLDIETTGLDYEKDQVIEIAALAWLWGDMDTDVMDMPHFHALVKHDRYRGQAEALVMNAGILAEIAELQKSKSEKCLWPNDAARAFRCFVDDVHWRKKVYGGDDMSVPPSHIWTKHVPDDKKRPFALGKNAASFDIPFLHAMGLPRGTFKSRVIDPAVLFSAPDDKGIPGLSECLERAGMEAGVSHRAMDDCRQTLEVLREGLRRLWGRK